MTPGEEEIMRIHEDRIYCSPDKIERTGGFWITSSSVRQGESCSRQTAPQQPIPTASDSDSELEELLRDTPEPGTPPVQYPGPGPSFSPGAARITEVAAYRTTGDLEAVVDKLQAWVEEQLPWLKDDLSSSETSNLRTPSPDIELEDLSESEEAAPGNIIPELHKGVFRFRDPEPVCTDEMDEAAVTAQEHPDQELQNEIFRCRELEQLTEERTVQEASKLDTIPGSEVERSQERENLHMYIQTRQRIEEQLQIDDLLWFTAVSASFWRPNTGVAGALEELRMLQVLIDGQRAAVLHAAKVWAAAEAQGTNSTDKTLNRCKLDQ